MEPQFPSPANPPGKDAGGDPPSSPKGRWRTFVGCRGPWIPITVAAINLALAFTTEFVTIRNFPNSGDEYAYLVSAEIFSRGRLSVPSPPLPRFFDVMHVVNDGKFYGKYPPGWPALLAVGVLAGAPWIVNPLLGAATVLAVHLLARRHYSVEIANVSSLLLLGNPFLIFNSASYFSHASCLLFIVLFFHFYLQCAEGSGGASSYAWMGLCAGLAFSIRPFTAVAMLTAPAIHHLLQARDPALRRRIGAGLGAASLPFLACLGLFLAYNHAQTGHALVQPFERFDPGDAPRAPRGAAEWNGRFKSHVLERGWDLNRWLPYSPVFLGLALCLRSTRRTPKVVVPAASFLSLFLAFFFYWGDGGFQYGPRYLYEALGMLTLVTAAVIVGFGERGALLMLPVFVLAASTYVTASSEFSRQVLAKQDVYRCAKDLGISKAILFLRTGSGPAHLQDCSRNGIDFNSPVLYVRDRGAENLLLLQEYADHAGFYYDFDPSLGKGKLTPLGPDARDR